MIAQSVAAFALGLWGPSANAANCEAIAQLGLPHTTLTIAKLETQETFKPGFIEAQGPPLENLPNFCRVAGEIHPTADSKIGFEVWMPVSGWNGRLMGVGNGGWSGEIWYPHMGVALRKGYATASTDTGHLGSFRDADFALGHPEKLIDFGYRAVHEMTIAAKAIITAYYGMGPQFSYWQGCSSGGKQGLKEAQTFPDDYDGIIAGAPANNWARLNASGVWVWQANHKGSARILTDAKLLLLHRAALNACDRIDGLVDSIIALPQSCHFDPKVLACSNKSNTQCLSPTEIEAAEKIYRGPKNPTTGELIFPGLEPGSELGWAMWSGGPEPLIAASYFRFVVFQNPRWKIDTFDFAQTVSAADQSDKGIISANDPNPERFFNRGGKLILYHGLSDPLIAPQNTINYYNEVVKTNSALASNGVRLFLAPGMNHCGGGEGPNVFDLSTPLVQWREHNIQPLDIVAEHFANDKTAKQPDRTRPLCAYPKISGYRGTGSVDKASRFACISR